MACQPRRYVCTHVCVVSIVQRRCAALPIPLSAIAHIVFFKVRLFVPTSHCAGGWRDPVLQELLGENHPATVVTMSFLDKTRSQLFEEYGLAEVGRAQGFMHVGLFVCLSFL